MPELTEHDAELLFAYIDGELAADEITALERRLTEDDFLQRELASLRQMVSLIQTLPEAKAPRAFTLTPEMLAPKTAPPLQVLPAAEPMIAATLAATPAPKPAPRRRIIWQSYAAAAAVFVLAVGFIGVALNNSPSTPANVAFAPTATSFSNIAVAQDNTVLPESQATTSDSDAASSNMALPAVLPTATKADIADNIEDAARKDPTEIALAQQPQTAEMQPEAGIMNAPADAETELGMDGMGGAPEIDSQLPGFSVNPDSNMQGFTVATLPPDALYYLQMTTTPVAPEIMPNQAIPQPPVAAQMTFAPDALAVGSTAAESVESPASEEAATDVELEGTFSGEASRVFTPNVRDGFLVLNGFVLLQWLLNRFVSGDS